MNFPQELYTLVKWSSDITENNIFNPDRFIITLNVKCSVSVY